MSLILELVTLFCTDIWVITISWFTLIPAVSRKYYLQQSDKYYYKITIKKYTVVVVIVFVAFNWQHNFEIDKNDKIRRYFPHFINFKNVPRTGKKDRQADRQKEREYTKHLNHFDIQLIRGSLQNPHPLEITTKQ